MTANCIIVSKCLLGYPCQYDGTTASRQLESWMIDRSDCQILAVCPEEMAGFPTPRPRLELVGGDGHKVLSGHAHVRTEDGDDRTDEMLSGANAVLRLARQHGVSQMIARRRSPSCSCNMIADGSFSGRFVDGVGVTVALLRSELGIPVVELEDTVLTIFTETIRAGFHIYRDKGDWTSKQERFAALLREKMPLAAPKEWSGILREAFHGMIHDLYESHTGHNAATFLDSDTIRFFQEGLRDGLGIAPIDPT